MDGHQTKFKSKLSNVPIIFYHDDLFTDDPRRMSGDFPILIYQEGVYDDIDQMSPCARFSVLQFADLTTQTFGRELLKLESLMIFATLQCAVMGCILK